MSRYGIVEKLEIVDYIDCTVCMIIYPIPYETLLLTCLLLLPLWESVLFYVLVYVTVCPF